MDGPPASLRGVFGARSTGLLLSVVLAGCGPGSVGSGEPREQGEESRERPASIVLILVDDVGFADLGCYASSRGATPHIDALAGAGTLFERAYATASICSPSRAGLLTGRYQQRFGHENNTGPLERQLELEIGLPPDEQPLSELLQGAGYATGLVGKWHLGAGPGFHPLERGFDEFFGHLSGGHTYLDWQDPKNGPIFRGREPVAQGEYLTDAFSREAVDFIERHREEPFFLFLSYNALHEPFEASAEALARHAQVQDEDARVRAAMLSSLDDGVGRVLAALERHGLEESTLVCFVSDNGPRRRGPGRAGAGLRGGKLSLYEGGVRVPFILRWPGNAAQAARVATPVSCLDIVPTCLEVAGISRPADLALDGSSLRPLVRGAAGAERVLFWRQGDKAAVSDGRLKLVRRRSGAVEAFDLAADPREERPLNPAAARFAGLQRALAGWESEMAEPLWNWSDGEDDS